MAFGFEKLNVYKLAIEFCAIVPPLLERTPKGYSSLADQLRRVMLSVPLNIAEGSGRGRGDARRFYQIARGSALECASVLFVLQAIGAAREDEIRPPLDKLDRIVAMLIGLERSASGPSGFGSESGSESGSEL